MMGAGAVFGGAGCFTRATYRGTVAGGAVLVPEGELAAAHDGVLVVRAPGGPGPIVVRRGGSGLVAVLAVCTHKACELDATPVGFECPCHGSSFGADGELFGGPAARPLERLPLRAVAGGARIEVGR